MTSLSQTSCKGSHNSYSHDEQPITEQVSDFAEAHQAGCRGLELDIQRDRDQWLWSVGHRHDYKGWVDQDLREYLRLLRRWSDSQPEKHEPIYLLVDNKDEWHDNRMHRSAGRSKDEWIEMWATQLDRVLREELGERKLWSPSNLGQWSGQKLIDVVRWPDITSEDLRGKFIPILSGKDNDIKQQYAELRGSRAAMFADRDVADLNELEDTIRDGHRVIVNTRALSDDMLAVLRRASDDERVLSRAWDANDQHSFDSCLVARANVISTDQIRNHNWATVVTDGAFPTRYRDWSTLPSVEVSADALDQLIATLRRISNLLG